MAEPLKQHHALLWEAFQRYSFAHQWARATHGKNRVTAIPYAWTAARTLYRRGKAPR